MKVFSWLTCFPVLLSRCGPNECMLAFEAGMGEGAGGRKFGGEVFVIGCEWDHVGKGEGSRFSGTELGMRLGQIIL